MTATRLSLNALRAYEASARLNSMTLAAEELAVTHGAISRHVRALEETLGLPLLRRTGYSVLPTEHGARLMDGLSAGFSLIDASVAQLRAELAAHDPFEHFFMLIQAAVCGLGLAVVPKMLVESELASGRLVAPLGFLAGPHRLVLWIAPHLRSRADMRAVLSWLDREMQAANGVDRPG